MRQKSGRMCFLVWSSNRREEIDVLGGEKQRIQLARVFYHGPKFVVLDESTSAVSSDVEALLYATAKEEGITIITISHRPTLFKYHNLLLRIGQGNEGKDWSLEKIGSGSSLILSVDAEIKSIEEKLGRTQQLRDRLTKINAELHLKPDASSVSKTVKRSLV